MGTKTTKTKTETLDARPIAERIAEMDSELDAYAGEGWPGDGSGVDDLADYNADEAYEYADEY